MVYMDSITEEPTINHSINDTNNNGGIDNESSNNELNSRHPIDEKPAEFANDTTNNIILYPFAHQVGGHTQLLTLDKSTLCKPLIPRELLFYLNVPKELVKFVPSYKGVVQIRKTGPGGAHQSVVYQPLRSPKSPYASKCKPGSSCTLPAKMGPRHMKADLCGFPFELQVQIRPCSDEKILKKNLSQDNLLRADYISRPNEKYLLLLENVASKYQLPCILDLKMGTRQHGDDATEEKRHRQIAKCQASTSASLGVRLCGMQVYRVDYGGFLWYDKYYGRKMDEEGLKRALQEYFQNGSQLNEDIIDDVINRLKLLSHAVENSPSFRFYGTSLLIIHEGCTSNRSNTKKCPVDVRLIDFAHTICDYSNATNGRSNSSPSVLKSNSADQLSTTISNQPREVTNFDERPDIAAKSDQKLTPIVSNPSSTSQSSTSASTSTFENRVQSNCAVLIADQDSSSQSERENYKPESTSATLRQPVASETEQDECANLGVCTSNIRPQLEKANLEKLFLPDEIDERLAPAQSQTTNGGNLTENLIQYNQFHPLREADHKTSSLIQAQEKQQRQIANSTPTSPPSLGNRKISKSATGPDKGLLFGLENLMRLLDDLKSDTLITSC